MDETTTVPICTQIIRTRRHAQIALEYGDIRGAIMFQTELWELKQRLVKEQADEFRRNVEAYKSQLFI